MRVLPVWRPWPAGGEITSTFDDPSNVKLGHCKVGGCRGWADAAGAAAATRTWLDQPAKGMQPPSLNRSPPTLQVIEEMMIGEDRMIHFSGCALNEACTIVLRGASERRRGRGAGGLAGCSAARGRGRSWRSTAAGACPSAALAPCLASPCLPALWLATLHREASIGTNEPTLCRRPPRAGRGGAVAARRAVRAEPDRARLARHLRRRLGGDAGARRGLQGRWGAGRASQQLLPPPLFPASATWQRHHNDPSIVFPCPASAFTDGARGGRAGGAHARQEEPGDGRVWPRAAPDTHHHL